MTVELYESQKKAVRDLSNGSILRGGVGTGKSRTALAYYQTRVRGGSLPKRNQLYSEGKDIPLYIITTARKRDTLDWEKECAPFLIHPTVIDSWNNIGKYAEVKDAFFIFDEQRVVGYGAWTKAFLKIASANKWILLSATPGDVWMDYMPVFIANGFYKNKTDFCQKHVVYDRFAKYPKVKRYIGEKHLRYLRDRIEVRMHFDKKATQHHEWIKVGYDSHIYDTVTESRWDIFESKPIKTPAELCALQRKIVNSDSRRLTAIGHLLELHPRAIIFYNFDYELELLRSYLGDSGIIFAEWNGHRHEMLPEGDSWAYLVQYTAGAEGWNCIETDTIIFYSQSYSYRATIQAAGRTDRLNSPYADLYYYHIFSDASIDQSIKACLGKKKNFNESSYSKRFLSDQGFYTAEKT